MSPVLSVISIVIISKVVISIIIIRKVVISIIIIRKVVIRIVIISKVVISIVIISKVAISNVIKGKVVLSVVIKSKVMISNVIISSVIVFATTFKIQTTLKCRLRLWPAGVDLIKLFVVNLLTLFWKLYLFKTQNNNGYINAMVWLTKKREYFYFIGKTTALLLRRIDQVVHENA
jgi:hypothetical protein